MATVLGALLGLCGLPLAPGIAAADPPVPPGLPWMPGAPVPVSGTMGSYSNLFNIIAVPPPAAFDARGIRATAGVDPAMAADGMPGSALGLSPNKANLLTSSSTRYRIGASLNPNPILPTVNPGTNIGAGMEVPTLEDPGGAAPKTAPGAESSQPTSMPAIPGQPAPILESPNGQPASATPTSAAPTPAGPPPVEVPAA
ncbi:hypothetical protein FZI85_20090 [Mycobacterium sp. CBMA293]|uniref:hypothetical protein n=1 Tax=unclassified Mycolicibacterium TaxID=2636767 RepID=UPI0012DE7C08|nr:MULTISPECIES: hypothetical protein [unclassified Mycolicibacterium]MUL48910.1 hypothetical protein [Mycolicibacterium sp. CBMA 360]MUL62521.1 hypothetical protein [Mycolicibacterium sp. CBMA 335]MUL74212.1 hypothetical protein [Mycolicibacterium sp. CBMA 311]MUL96906.1 hypothetical protein [Mycolicibacterium sp. CBMA 230]MUM13310.1 hypothetical protein [Mycolicibacterium sp. CBMA 293]